MLDDFLTEIRAFLKETGMSASYFGKAACGNSELVNRLATGKTITVRTVLRVQGFMAARRNGEKIRYRPIPREDRAA